jgi:hypothetical protein
VGVGDVPDWSSQGIFLSYRREDAAPYARLLQRELRDRFSGARVFMDLDSIEAGVRFAEVIRDAVGSSAVLVALIGRHWLTLADEEGRRRLDNPDDFVRFEVQTALERGVRVIPVLVDDARPLRQQELPSGLEELAALSFFELSSARYDYDAGRLLDLIQRVLAAIRDREEADRKAREEAKLKVLEERAHYTGHAGDAAGARDQFAALVPVYERVFGAEHPEALRVRNDLAWWTGQAGDATAARDQLAVLVPVRERVSGPEDPGTLRARNDLAHWTGQARS